MACFQFNSSAISAGVAKSLPSCGKGSKQWWDLPLSISNHSHRKKNGVVRMSASDDHQWLQQSAYEIVKHLQEAPFLYLACETQSPSRIKRKRITLDFVDGAKSNYKTNIGDNQLWDALKEEVSNMAPDRVILVQRLDGEKWHNIGYNKRGDLTFDNNKGSTGSWGLVFVGRSIAQSSCYILQTTRVCSTVGACTHFCLTKAQCFGPSAMEQIDRIWLTKD